MWGVLATSPAVRWIKAQPRGWKGRFSGRGRNSIGYAADMADVTQILNAIEHGDPRAAAELLPLVYDELRSLPRPRLANEKPGQTLQATALVHEAYLRLVGVRAEPGLEQPRSLLRRRGRGHAPHPRRCTPAASRPTSAAADRASRPGRDDVGRHGAGPTTCWPSTMPSTRLAADEPASGPAGQTPVLRRADREEAAEASASARSTADAHWAYARAWLYDAC